MPLQHLDIFQPYTEMQSETLLIARLAKRLQELKSEYARGCRILAAVESQPSDVQHSLLRLSGAIQVLEEELARVDHRRL